LVRVEGAGRKKLEWNLTNPPLTLSPLAPLHTMTDATATGKPQVVLAEETRKQQTYEHMQNRARNGAEDASKELDLLQLEVAALGRDLFNLEIYLRDTRRLRAKSEDALNWMQENYNFRVSEA
jgi:hypothetical protein